MALGDPKNGGKEHAINKQKLLDKNRGDRKTQPEAAIVKGERSAANTMKRPGRYSPCGKMVAL